MSYEWLESDEWAEQLRRSGQIVERMFDLYGPADANYALGVRLGAEFVLLKVLDGLAASGPEGLELYGRLLDFVERGVDGWTWAAITAQLKTDDAGDGRQGGARP